MEINKTAFDFLTTITPIVNVDLIIKDEYNNILMAWRHDEMFHGWHIPGRIIRFKESFKEAISNCTRQEIGYDLYSDKLLEYFEYIHPKRKTRGHFITFVYECFLLNKKINEKVNNLVPGDLRWFKHMPINIIEEHKRYEKYFRKE